VDNLLEKIRSFAANAHGEQTRKYTPDPYIVHPVRVMETCRQYTTNITVLAAALMHDVLEDTPVTKEEIRDFLLYFIDNKQANETVSLVARIIRNGIAANENRRKRIDLLTQARMPRPSNMRTSLTTAQR
jgi:guanosine-3',5'-bis(diphosphate) 3'-pyrophosphohydrolase